MRTADKRCFPHQLEDMARRHRFAVSILQQRPLSVLHALNWSAVNPAAVWKASKTSGEETLLFHLVSGRKKWFRSASLLAEKGWGESSRQKRFMMWLSQKLYCQPQAATEDRNGTAVLPEWDRKDSGEKCYFTSSFSWSQGKPITHHNSSSLYQAGTEQLPATPLGHSSAGWHRRNDTAWDFHLLAWVARKEERLQICRDEIIQKKQNRICKSLSNNANTTAVTNETHRVRFRNSSSFISSLFFP